MQEGEGVAALPSGQSSLARQYPRGGSNSKRAHLSSCWQARQLSSVCPLADLLSASFQAIIAGDTCLFRDTRDFCSDRTYGDPQLCRPGPPSCSYSCQI